MHQLCQLFLLHAWMKLDTRQPRRTQQQGKLFFCRSAFERHAIQQQLHSGRAQQQSVFSVFWNCRAQLAPRNIQLLHRSCMLVTVQAGELQQYVQASYKGAGSCRLRVRFHPRLGFLRPTKIRALALEYTLPSTLGPLLVPHNGTVVPCDAPVISPHGQSLHLLFRTVFLREGQELFSKLFFRKEFTSKSPCGLGGAFDS